MIAILNVCVVNISYNRIDATNVINAVKIPLANFLPDICDTNNFMDI